MKLTVVEKSHVITERFKRSRRFGTERNGRVVHERFNKLADLRKYYKLKYKAHLLV